MRALEGRLSMEDLRLKSLFERLEGLNPLAILKRGYSVTSIADTGEVVFSSKSVSSGIKIRTKLAEGEFISKVI
ncbi:MAG TPA: exodeoxyribonuclease VII large subunit [Candidatus Omnitrophota bacterium]|nr:exodeoxyribonuclease VII large subunit [Candidatus Omnitrophota bacterium]